MPSPRAARHKQSPTAIHPYIVTGTKSRAMDDLCYVLYGNHPLSTIPPLFRVARKIRVICRFSLKLVRSRYLIRTIVSTFLFLFFLPLRRKFSCDLSIYLSTSYIYVIVLT